MSRETLSDKLKREAVEFGTWLMQRGLVHNSETAGYRVGIEVGADLRDLYDTPEGEWLTMDELYDLWLNELRESWEQIK